MSLGNSMLDDFVRQINMSKEARDDKRLRQIQAYRYAGVSTWVEEQEYIQIRRRQIDRELERE